MLTLLCTMTERISRLINFAPNMAYYKDRGVFVIIYTFYLWLTEAHECRLGYYGANCDSTCGHCIGGHAYCDVFDGFCANGCSSGYMGPTCETACPPTHYGHNCEKECPPNCKDLGCDPISGECSSNGCKPGFRGQFCDQACLQNTYGQGCLQACKCSLCGCHPVSGSCFKNCKHVREAPINDEVGNKKTVFIHQAYTHKKQTRLACQELETVFKHIISIVSATQPVTPWPIAVFLMLLLIGMVLKWKKHVEQMHLHEDRHEQWVEEFLQLYGEDIEVKEPNIEEQKSLKSTNETIASSMTV